MNKNMNPWMISTIFLIGLFAGFGLGNINSIGKGSMIEASAITTTTAAPTPTNTNLPTSPAVQPQTMNTLATVNYDSIAKNKAANGNWSVGSDSAKVVVEEFSDFQCPFCHKYFAEVFPQIFQNYIASGKIKYTYYNYPLSFHAQAAKAAEVSLCAGDQNKYWEMHDLLFQNQDIWSLQTTGETKLYESLAETLKLKAADFKQCLTSNKYTAQVQKDTATGEKNGVSGTPTFIINGKKLVGAQPYEVIKQSIEESLK